MTLINTDEQHPKNAKELAAAINERSKIISGQEIKLSDSTIYRNIDDINASGLMEIQTSENKNAGFYRADFAITAPEAVLIAQSMFHSADISWESAAKLLTALKRHTDTKGREYIDYIIWQLKLTDMRRKAHNNKILYNIDKILGAIIKQKQISFKYFIRDERPSIGRNFVRDSDGKPAVFKVSPYYLSWNNGKCYLICHDPQKDKGDEKFLSHFKVSHMTMIENFDYADNVSIMRMSEYKRYAGLITSPANGKWTDRLDLARPPKTEKEALKLFSLERYTRENIYM